MLDVPAYRNNQQRRKREIITINFRNTFANMQDNKFLHKKAG